MNGLAPPKGMKRLSPLRRPKKAAALPDLGGKRDKPGGEEQSPPPSVAKTEFDLTPDQEDRLANELGNRYLARKVTGLRKEFPYGTVPELLTLDFLRTNKERYTYQAQLFGGFRPGGSVPDFLVMRNATVTALLIQGNYWHNLPGMKQADEVDRYRLLGTTYEGQRIQRVVFVWESRLMRDRDDTLRSALSGVELGP